MATALLTSKKLCQSSQGKKSILDIKKRGKREERNFIENNYLWLQQHNFDGEREKRKNNRNLLTLTFEQTDSAALQGEDALEA